MTDNNDSKYCRQITLDLIGEKGQKELLKKKVAIIGAGAHGSGAAMMLVRLGVGKIIMFDKDKIRADNLHRQILYDEKDVGKNKIDIAVKKLYAINSDVEIIGVNEFLDESNIKKLKSYDLIIDCTDEIPVRMLINKFSLKNNIPWIYTGAIRTYGRIYVNVPEDNDKLNRGCFRCFTKTEETIEKCRTAGVLNTITFAIPSMAVTQGVKVMLKKDYEKSLLIFDIWDNSISKIKIKKDKKCPHCSK